MVMKYLVLMMIIIIQEHENDIEKDDYDISI